MKFRFFFLLFILIYFSFCNPLQARVYRVIVTKTEPYSDGKVFGQAGSFEKLTGQAYGEIDPDNKLNSFIQDIQLAPRNSRGMVDYISDFIILRPTDMAKCNGILFLSLPNRGNAFPADTALLGRGYIYFWCAWQGDILRGNNRLTMRVPYASEKGSTIAGILRTEFQVNSETATLNLSSGFFTGLTHYSYETVSLNNTDIALTKRILESDTRDTVPGSEWAFSDCSKGRFPGIPSTTKISLRNGFQPNFIYELIYTAKDPLVLGLGFAAIRDVSSFLRHKRNLKDMKKLRIPLKGLLLQRVII